jgi:hypothetical protein
MILNNHNRARATLALTLALGATAPAAASAMPLRADPPAPADQRAVELVQVSADPGFDWADAGIGAAGGLGLSMLAVGGVLVAQRRGHRSSAQAAR